MEQNLVHKVLFGIGKDFYAKTLFSMIFLTENNYNTKKFNMQYPL